MSEPALFSNNDDVIPAALVNKPAVHTNAPLEEPARLVPAQQLRRWADVGLRVLLIGCLHQSVLSGAWHAYEAAALSRPIVTKAATSGVAYFLGDSIAQQLAGTRDAGRLASASIAGALSHGPQLHFWTMLLERFPLPLAAKVALDQTVFSLYLNAAFCVTTDLLQRRPLRIALQKVRATAWPCLKAGWRFWPLAHALTYSVIPLHLRVLWVDALEVGWVTILSTCIARGDRGTRASGEAVSAQ